MAPKMELLAIFFISFASIFFSIAASNDSENNITRWCNKTPHPETCKQFSTESHKHLGIKDFSEFRTTMIGVAMERAIAAKVQVKQCKPDIQSERQRAAWNDCLTLYSITVIQLNRTLQGLGRENTSCTDSDAQTWLSTALTNIKTCQTGFLELNVSLMRPMMSNNLSKLISNSLATNGVLLSAKRNTNNTSTSYPSWLLGQGRKLLQSRTLASKANLVVSKDGSGNLTTIQAAIDAAERRSGRERFIIHVKKGVYIENIEVGINNNNVVLVGDGMKNTIITNSRSVAGGYTTYSSATAGVTGEGFIACDITFRNTAGPQNRQAVTLRSGSDFSVFFRCGFEGYQDTLYVYSQRQFYKDCHIYGTVDIIFGNGAAVLQNCIIYARRPMNNQKNIITAQGRTDPNQNTGISIQKSLVLAASDLKPVLGSFRTYLGRPWKRYSRTVFVESYLDSLVDPAGWLEWDGNFALDTLYYGEYKNIGPGSSTGDRVRWPGYHVINSTTEASSFTVANLISGSSWLPTTGVPFKPGL